MLTSFWSVKGGSGTTVVAAAHALVLGGRGTDVLLVDLGGDVPTVLGTTADRGVFDWLAADDDTPSAALDRLCRPVTDRVRLLGCGAVAEGDDRRPGPNTGPRRAAVRIGALVDHLRRWPGEVVVDAGCRPRGAAARIVDASHESIAVTRLCYVALDRLRRSTRRPTGLVVVHEPGRALGTHDAAAVAGPVLAEVAFDRAVARTVDAGLLAHRLPKPLTRLGLDQPPGTRR